MRWQNATCAEQVGRKATIQRAMEQLTKARLALEEHIDLYIASHMSTAARAALEGDQAA